ncbi:MAG: fructokinase [Colwellia sp.]|jgi:fructokinase|tara:strand:+ start:8894 stop:9874 length:981 start_codon:yes stop_codon:yes gene_type:complete
MNPVICFGEALIDFLMINQLDEQPLLLNEFRQYPGGAPANVAVAIAKLGGKALFAGQVGKDSFGDFLQNSLEFYQVDTTLMSRHPQAKTALAFVMLDSVGERSFSFYRDQTADLLFDKTQVGQDWFTPASIFHFCSNTLTQKNIADTTQYALSLAKLKGSIISFDVNLRANLWPEGVVDRIEVNKLAKQADVLKYSKDELLYLAEGDEQTYINNLIHNGVSLILVTDGAEIIHYYCADESSQVVPPTVKAIDTTAGGDAFIGAFLFGLSQVSQPKKFLSQAKSFVPLISFSAHCGAHAVAQQGAFPALPTFADVSSHWQRVQTEQL